MGQKNRDALLEQKDFMFLSLLPAKGILLGFVDHSKCVVNFFLKLCLEVQGQQVKQIVWKLTGFPLPLLRIMSHILELQIKRRPGGAARGLDRAAEQPPCQRACCPERAREIQCDAG